MCLTVYLRDGLCNVLRAVCLAGHRGALQPELRYYGLMEAKAACVSAPWRFDTLNGINLCEGNCYQTTRWGGIGASSTGISGGRCHIAVELVSGNMCRFGFDDKDGRVRLSFDTHFCKLMFPHAILQPFVGLVQALMAG